MSDMMLSTPLAVSVSPNQPQIDITHPAHGVQIELRDDGRVLWVHVDGITVLRICMLDRFEININEFTITKIQK